MPVRVDTSRPHSVAVSAADQSSSAEGSSERKDARLVVNRPSTEPQTVDGTATSAWV